VPIAITFRQDPAVSAALQDHCIFEARHLGIEAVRARIMPATHLLRCARTARALPTNSLVTSFAAPSTSPTAGASSRGESAWTSPIERDVGDQQRAALAPTGVGGFGGHGMAALTSRLFDFGKLGPSLWERQ
jgi:hypothetical protein